MSIRDHPLKFERPTGSHAPIHNNTSAIRYMLLQQLNSGCGSIIFITREQPPHIKGVVEHPPVLSRRLLAHLPPFPCTPKKCFQGLESQSDVVWSDHHEKLADVGVGELNRLTLRNSSSSTSHTVLCLI